MRRFYFSTDGIFVQDGDKKLHFTDPADLKHYGGPDLAQKLDGAVSVSYEPLRDMHFIFDGIETTIGAIPDAVYESILDKIELYEFRKNDIYYGLDEPAKAAAMLEASKRAISAQRYATETSGVSYQGMTILTDRESVQILDSTCDKIRRGLVPSVDWKCVGGYLTLTPSNIDALEIAILTHVQTAFAWEKAQLESIG